MRFALGLFVVSLALSVPARAQDPAPVALTSAAETGELGESLRREAQAAVDRGRQWLIANQQESGNWSSPAYPALTGLAVWALAMGEENQSPVVRKGLAFILNCVHPDGSIWRAPAENQQGGGLSNYNTAICMVALHVANDPALSPVVAAARRFVAGSQHTGADEYRGGMGYEADGRAYADLSNSYVGYEAMYLTRRLKDLQSGAPEAELDWDAAISFVSSLQNDDGGFIYRPGESKAGSVTNEAGEVTFRSYGSMTYAGLLSLIYADVDRDDPRVRSAADWAAAHWSLEENPGVGQEGLYYFYNVLAKALAAYGQDVLQTSDGASIAWRPALVRKLVSLQRIDEKGLGHWQNPEGRWFEQDPVLVTSYSLIALQIALGAENGE